MLIGYFDGGMRHVLSQNKKMDEEQVADALESLRRSNISEKTRANYHRRIFQFLKWLFHEKPLIFTPKFNRACVRRRVLSLDDVREFIKAEDASAPPIKFSELTAETILHWVVYIRDTSIAHGEHHSFGTFSQHRAAIKHLFRAYRVEMDPVTSSEIAIHFKGLKRQTAQALGAGNGRVQTGKDPLPFGLYKRLAITFMRSSRNEHTFCHTFMVFCWNLMCRPAIANRYVLII